MKMNMPRQKLLWVTTNDPKNKEMLWLLQNCGMYDVQVVTKEEYVGSGYTGTKPDAFIVDDVCVIDGLSDHFNKDLVERSNLMFVSDVAAYAIRGTAKTNMLCDLMELSLDNLPVNCAPPEEPKSKQAQWKTERQWYRRK